MKNNSVADLLFPLQYRRKVLAALLMRVGESFHLRELARLTGIGSPGSLKKELDQLVQAGLVKMARVGNQTLFCANVAHPVFPELQGLVRKTAGLVDMLQQALAPLLGLIDVACVYGSVARGTDTAQSDVDVLLIGDVSFAQAVLALHDCQSVLGREINPKVFSRSEWQAKKLAGNSFFQDVLDKPKMFVVGAEGDL
jgi:predicted nucleotidyltransferase